MKHKMFVIYDVKANAYMQPWFLTQEGMALRAFSDCVNDADHNFGRHPEDYTLFNIGSFDDANADIKWQPPKSMGNGLEFVRSEDTQPDLFNKTLPDKILDSLGPHQRTDGEDT